jgi:hypothetical protein
LNALTDDGSTITVEVGVVLRRLVATDKEPVIGEAISLDNPGTGQPEPYTVIASSATGLLLTDGSLVYLLGDAGISAGTIVQTETNTANTPCFAAGTRILTAQGEKPVEALAVGDLVLALLGQRLARIAWIGHTERNLAWGHRDSFPVRIQAGAIADGQPHRDLLLSPDHALLIDSRLVPVRHLVNGASIAHVTDMTRIAYFHVELDRHDAVLAEGMPAESFLDTGNRRQFDGSNIYSLFPAKTPDPDAALRVWAERGCAPLLLAGPILAALHRRLRERATMLGHELTEDADLHIVAGNAPLATTRIGPGAWQALLPAGTTSVAVLSRCGPAHEIASGLDDHRCLGVALAGLSLDGTAIALDGPALTGGAHPPEPGCRWTDGAAMLQLPAAATPRLLRVETHPGWRLYWNKQHPVPAGRRA